MPIPALYAATLALMPAIFVEAKAMQQDPWTMAAIVFTESRGVASAIKHESNGSCSVGLAGINVPDCDPVAVDHLLQAQANLRTQAVILAKGAAWCREHPTTATCRRGGAVAQYNAGDKGYAKRVRAAARALKRAWLSRRTPQA